MCQSLPRDESRGFFGRPHQWTGCGVVGRERQEEEDTWVLCTGRPSFCWGVRWALEEAPTADGTPADTDGLGGHLCRRRAEERGLGGGGRPGRLLGGRAAGPDKTDTVFLDLGAGFLPGKTAGRKLRRRRMVCFVSSEETLSQTEGHWKAVLKQKCARSIEPSQSQAGKGFTLDSSD